MQRRGSRRPAGLGRLRDSGPRGRATSIDVQRVRGEPRRERNRGIEPEVPAAPPRSPERCCPRPQPGSRRRGSDEDDMCRTRGSSGLAGGPTAGGHELQDRESFHGREVGTVAGRDSRHAGVLDAELFAQHRDLRGQSFAVSGEPHAGDGAVDAPASHLHDGEVGQGDELQQAGVDVLGPVAGKGDGHPARFSRSRGLRQSSARLRPVRSIGPRWECRSRILCACAGRQKPSCPARRAR